MHVNRLLILALIASLVLAPVLTKGETDMAGSYKTIRLYLTPSDSLMVDAYGMIKCDMEGQVLSFKAKAQGLTSRNYYGLFSGGELLGVDFGTGGEVYFEGRRDFSLIASSFEIWTVGFSGDGVYKKERVLITEERALRTETFVR